MLPTHDETWMSRKQARVRDVLSSCRVLIPTVNGSACVNEIGEGLLSRLSIFHCPRTVAWVPADERDRPKQHRTRQIARYRNLTHPVANCGCVQ